MIKALSLLALSTIIILVLSLSFNTPLGTSSQTNIPTNVSISLDTDNVEVGIQIRGSMLITPPPPAPTDVFHFLNVTATDPLGRIQTLGPFTTFSNGSQSFFFVPDTIGTYTFLGNFTGETIV
jgi:hypothetical protein